MKNIENKGKEIEISELSTKREKNRKYSSPRKNESNINYFHKKFSKTFKKQKHNLIKINETEKTNNQKQKQTLLFRQNENKKKEYPIVINTSQNFTPNKRKNMKFRLSETQSKQKDKMIPPPPENSCKNDNKKTNYLIKTNRLVYKCNSKPNKSNNINTLILNFKKDIPSYQIRIPSVTSKKTNNNNINNNSYILNQKRNILKEKNKITGSNYDNYTVRTGREKYNNNPSNKNKKRKDKKLSDNQINKEYFKSYIINKYSSSFIKNPIKENENSKYLNKNKINNDKSAKKNKNKDKDIKYQTNFNFHKNDNKIKKNSIIKNQMNSKKKSSMSVKNNKKIDVIKKKSYSSLTTNKKAENKKDSLILFNKNNIHYMTEFSESFKNNSIPALNKIKFNLNTKFKLNTDRDVIFPNRFGDGDTEMIKKIKKDLNVKKLSATERKNKPIKNKRKNKRKNNMQYPRMNSHKILITNININLYKALNDCNKKEDNIEDNLNINSDDTRNTNLNINLNESILNLEKIYLLEEKIRKILSKINEYQKCEEEAQNYITFYFSINFYKIQLELFKNSKNQKKMSNYIKLEILCYFLCYNISFNENFSQASILLKTIINLLHDNYLILMSYILYLNKSKIYDNNNDNDNNSLWINKIEKIIENKLKINLTNQDMNENSILSIIIGSVKTLINYYQMIIDNLYFNNINIEDKIDYKYIIPNCLKLNLNQINYDDKIKLISLFFTHSYKILNNYSFEDMKLFFYLYLNNNTTIPKNNSSNNTTNNNISNYYLPPIKKNYKYSLLLNLDETLIYNDNGKIIIRPNLYNFLTMMKELYELIIFSFESNSFIDNAIEIIEQNNKYFDYILYANQFTLNNKGKLLKDLEALGRNIKNIIVIDSKSHIDKKFKKNLILIKGFYGNNLIDINLLKILGYILQNIKKENNDDIRLSIDKYKNTIKTYLMNNT